jgi:hypothetical protein
LDRDNGLGRGQLLRQALVLAPQAGEFPGRRIGRQGSPAPWLQGIQFPALPLPALLQPKDQMRGVEAFPAQEGTELTLGAAAGVGFP